MCEHAFGQLSVKCVMEYMILVCAFLEVPYR